MLGNRRKLPTGKNNLRKTNGARSPTICRTRGNLADKSPASAVQSRPGEKSRNWQNGPLQSGHYTTDESRTIFRADKEGNKKPSVPKSAGGVSEYPRISTCSLAVFYVEQVALNRHVSPQQAALILMTGKVPIVNTVSKAQHSVTTIFQFVASKRERKLSQRTSKATPAIWTVCFPVQHLHWTTSVSSQCYTQWRRVRLARAVRRRREYRSSKDG